MQSFCSRASTGFLKQRCQVLGASDALMYADAVTMSMPPQEDHHSILLMLRSTNPACRSKRSGGLEINIECVMRHAPLTLRNKFDQAIPLLKKAGQSTYDDSVTRFVAYLKDTQKLNKLGSQFKLVNTTTGVDLIVTGPSIIDEDNASLAYWGELLTWIGQEYIFFVMHASARKRATQAGLKASQVTAIDIMQEMQLLQDT